MGITQSLNEQIPPGIVFRDETGRAVRLGDYFGKKPIVLSLVYFACPALCPMVLSGELQTMKAMSLGLGKDYDARDRQFRPKGYARGCQGQAGRLHGPVRATRGCGKLALSDGRAAID